MSIDTLRIIQEYLEVIKRDSVDYKKDWLTIRATHVYTEEENSFSTKKTMYKYCSIIIDLPNGNGIIGGSVDRIYYNTDEELQDILKFYGVV